MEYGVQTYTLRMYMQTEKDIAHSLKAIADMGYRNVQISGIGSITPFKLRALCDERNLRIVLTHSPEARIIADTEALIAEHKILGCRYIGLGAMSEKYRSEAWIDRFAADFTTPAQKIADAGMRFMYHQHNFEFERLANGQTLMERLLEQMPTELMGVTADTYWLQAGGVDVCAWLKKHRDRLQCVHLKDMAVHGFEPRMAAVGQGNLNFPAILQELCHNGVTEYALVEQDDCYGQSAFECLRKSLLYLQEVRG